MNNQEFTNIFNDTMMALEQLVEHKGSQYATTRDRLHNFNMAGKILGISTLQACQGMWMKQLVSLFDEINKLPVEKPWSQDRCDEVINDLLVYLILTKAIFYRENGWMPESLSEHPSVVGDMFCKKTRSRSTCASPQTEPEILSCVCGKTFSRPAYGEHLLRGECLINVEFIICTCGTSFSRPAFADHLQDGRCPKDSP